jgi:hypothetical protein
MRIFVLRLHVYGGGRRHDATRIRVLLKLSVTPFYRCAPSRSISFGSVNPFEKKAITLRCFVVSSNIAAGCDGTCRRAPAVRPEPRRTMKGPAA